MKLNGNNLEVLWVESSSVPESGSTTRLVRIALSPKASVHSLGVPLDPGLLLDVLIAAVARSVCYQLRLVCQLHPLPR